MFIYSIYFKHYENIINILNFLICLIFNEWLETLFYKKRIVRLNPHLFHKLHHSELKLYLVQILL